MRRRAGDIQKWRRRDWRGGIDAGGARGARMHVAAAAAATATAVAHPKAVARHSPACVARRSMWLCASRAAVNRRTNTACSTARGSIPASPSRAAKYGAQRKRTHRRRRQGNPPQMWRAIGAGEGRWAGPVPAGASARDVGSRTCARRRRSRSARHVVLHRARRAAWPRLRLLCRQPRVPQRRGLQPQPQRAQHAQRRAAARGLH